MFALIVVLLTGSPDEMTIRASNLGFFNSFQDCFAARESFSASVFGMPEGYYPPNTQAVCIPLVVNKGEGT